MHGLARLRSLQPATSRSRTTLVGHSRHLSEILEPVETEAPPRPPPSSAGSNRAHDRRSFTPLKHRKSASHRRLSESRTMAAAKELEAEGDRYFLRGWIDASRDSRNVRISSPHRGYYNPWTWRWDARPRPYANNRASGPINEWASIVLQHHTHYRPWAFVEVQRDR
jgi:hypothetical protein